MSNEDALDSWESLGSNITLYSRILISIISVAYAQCAQDGNLNDYVKSLSPEIKNAFKYHAQHILDEYKISVIKNIEQEKIELSWIDTAKYGISTILDDFAISQISSFKSLENFVRERTSFKNQIMIAFAIALALAVFVGNVKNAVTVFDDIKSSFVSKELNNAS